MPNPACVLIIERHPLMRAALTSIIADHGTMGSVLQSMDGTQALQMIDTQPPDIILFALDQTHVDDLDALEALHKRLPDSLLLALSSEDLPVQENAALRRGARAVLNKCLSREELLHAILALWQEQRLPPQA